MGECGNDEILRREATDALDIAQRDPCVHCRMEEALLLVLSLFFRQFSRGD